MSQDTQDQDIKAELTSPDLNEKDMKLCDEDNDEALVENTAIANELLSDEELVSVSGGANLELNDLSYQEDISHLTKSGATILEPGPTFPAPPSPESL